MAASAPFSYSATFQYPPDIGAANASIPVSMSGSFESKASFDYKLSGAGTKTVDFGTIVANGAKLISIEVDPDSSLAAQPVIININGSGTGGIEIAPGGFLTVGNPKPTASGILSMEIVHAADVCVRVRVLG